MKRESGVLSPTFKTSRDKDDFKNISGSSRFCPPLLLHRPQVPPYWGQTTSSIRPPTWLLVTPLSYPQAFWWRRSQSSKSNLVPCMQILGPFGPPKKRVNFNICNKWQKWIICECQFDTLSFPLRMKFCCPLHCFYHLNALVPWALKANKFSGPPALWSPKTCFGPPPCASILRTGDHCSHEHLPKGRAATWSCQRKIQNKAKEKQASAQGNL